MMMPARCRGECMAMNLPPPWLLPEILSPPLSQAYVTDVQRGRNDL